MAEQKNFAVEPSVSITRSKFQRNSQHKTSINLGKCVPIYIDEVLPGDTKSFDVASLIRMSTPIAPIMDNIKLDLLAFYVPSRLCWKSWKAFMGENVSGAGASDFDVPTPTCKISHVISASNYIGSLADYMGIPYIENVEVDESSSITNGPLVSALPFRAYYLIWNRFFRDQNYMAPQPVQLGNDTGEGSILVDNDDNIYNLKPLPVCKLSDYFTRALPYAQKGGAVTIPISGDMPVVIGSSFHDINPDINMINAFAHNSGTSYSMLNGASIKNGSATSGNSGLLADTSYSDYDSSINSTSLVARVDDSVQATINQLRYAFQLQKYLEKQALYGSRYYELLYANFGVTAPDATLQDPEFLGSTRIHINIDQVLQTTGYKDDTSSDLAQVGANSVTGSKDSLFTKSFIEHGYVMVIACARQEHTYGQGIDRLWTRRDRLDYYYPVFANLGAQEIKAQELLATNVKADNEAVVGYQEAWAEYRYKPSRVSAYLNPNNANSLDYWTLADTLDSALIGEDFITEDRSNISRALVTGTMGPDFICDFYFLDTCVRPMPVHSIPGLIDHH